MKQTIPIAKQIRTVKSIIDSFERELQLRQTDRARLTAEDTVANLLAVLRTLQRLESGEQGDLF